MSLSQTYGFLNVNGEKIDSFASRYAGGLPARNDVSIKEEAVKALAKYVNYRLSKESAEEELQKIAFVQVNNISPIPLVEVFRQAQTDMNHFAVEINTIARVWPEIKMREPQERAAPIQGGAQPR